MEGNGASALTRSWHRWMPAATDRSWLWIIFLAALLVRIAIILIRKTYLQLEHVEPASIALSLLHNGTFANAYCATSGPTAHTGPVYVWMLTPLFFLFGEGTGTQLAIEVMSSCWAAAVYLLLPLLTETLGAGRIPGIAAGLLGGLLPFNFWAETKGSFEQPVATFLLVLLVLLTNRIVRAPQHTLAKLLPTAAVVSLLALTSSVMIPPLTLVVLAALWRLPRPAALRLAGLTAVGLTLFLLPWGYRNHRELDKWVFTRSNFGLELWLSNNDRATADYNTNLDLGIMRMHPASVGGACAELSAMGEIAFHARAMRTAQAWISAHPQRFLRLTVERAYLFWIPQMRRPAQVLISWLLPALGVAGLFLLFRRQPWAVYLLVAVALGYQSTFLFVQSFARYSYPVQWILWIGVGMIVEAALTRRSGPAIN